MQSIMGALLTAGFAASVSKAIGSAPNKSLITGNVENALTKSFSSAESVAHQYPQYASAITAAARSSFVSGSNWAYAAGAIAIVFGAGLIYRCFPDKDEEQRLLAAYHAQDASSQRTPPDATTAQPSPSM